MSQKQLARDMQTEFQARFHAKQARRESQKAAKQDGELRKQIQNLLKKGETQQAAQKARMLLAKQAIATQMDQAADMAELSVAQIQANNAMNRMTAMMQQSSRTMSRAQRSVNPERTLVALEQYRTQNEDYAMSNSIYTDAMTQNTSVQVSDDAVHELLGKLADDAGVELSQELNSAQVSKTEPVREPAAAEPTAEEEDALQQRLRALRA
ncbi:chromatin modifying protein 1b [Grosmannia clavigera kw1407]|uniref:Chromatin modifying protein 1b n=1 Tax=Grosmannia clavigera (strain kw1407 / UAMH 11150) TaxID=655863 RepID=F0XB02_GROCL|nr:chromatin modifying protein 1b [Grosmannia clavigera kw1407]EFX05144.1 chromatin modifying protein 1b [Grosmannia clavigera kw1407]